MPEAPVLETPNPTESLGWRAGLPDDLKQNEAFVPFKTVGDFAKTDLELPTKTADLERKLGGSVPKLADNASDADRSLYYDALGRPKQPSEYKLPGEDKNAPEWNAAVRQHLYETGSTASQAEAHVNWFNGVMQKMVDDHNTSLKNEITAAETKFRSELGDKFDTHVELAKRMWSKYGEGEFDKAFDRETSVTRVPIMRMILKFASATGEDRSPQGGQSQGGGSKGTTFIDYSVKGPMPAAKR